MISFTPLAGAANSTSCGALAYLLQVDDVRILLDCGAPEWNLEAHAENAEPPWEAYCQALETCVIGIRVNVKERAHDDVCSHAQSVDLVLLSHGDLAHSGLYAYAYSRWNLRAPAYCTYPVQAIGRLATVEDILSLRAEEPFPEDSKDESGGTEELAENAAAALTIWKVHGKRVASVKDAQEAFDTLNTLRYSQPTHLQGAHPQTRLATSLTFFSPQANARD